MTFHWTPAACNPPWSAMAIYIRYRRKRSDTIEVTSWSSQHTQYRTPDRDLLLTNDANFQNATRPLNEHWDEMVLLSPYTASYKDYDFKYAMNNFTTYLKDKSYITNHRKPGSFNRDGVVWISDSGGFQFNLMSLKYLDPAQIVDWYSNNSDIGIALDIPVATSHDLLHQANRVQKRNTKIMLERKRDSLELMTALHGASRTDYLRSAKYLHNDQITKLSISGFQDATVTESLISLLSIHKRFGQHYDHLHILGVSDIMKILVYARWAAIRVPDLTITLDSSRHIQEALRWGYYSRIGTSQRIKKIRIGSDYIVTPEPTSPQLLPCQCEVCQAIKYVEIFALTRSSVIAPYLILYHNQFIIRDIITKITDYARVMDDANYLDFAKSMIRPRDHLQLRAGLQIIDDFEKYGGRKTAKQYKYHAVRSRLYEEDLANERIEDSQNIKDKYQYRKKIIRGYLKNKFKPEDHAKPYKAEE